MKQILCAGLVGLLGVACGSSGDSGELSGPHEDPAVAESELEVLHRFSTNGTEYEFLYGGPDEFLMNATGPLTNMLLPELSDGSPPTVLEIYLALAPEGDAPDPRLVDYHVQEARLLGRPDNSVLHAKLDLNAPVEKSVESNYQACLAYTIGKLPSNTGGWTASVNGTNFGSPISWGAGTVSTLPMSAAVCNLGGAASFSHYKYSKPASALDWAYLGGGTLGVNQVSYCRWAQTSYTKHLRIDATGPGQIFNAWYQ